MLDDGGERERVRGEIYTRVSLEFLQENIS